MLASFVTVDHGGQPSTWKLLLPRYRYPTSESLRVFAAHPIVDLPRTFFAPVAWFPSQFWDARAVGFSTASNNEIPDDASESRSLAAQYGRRASIWTKSDLIRPKTFGPNPSDLAGDLEISVLPAVAAVPNSQTPTRAGCECSIEVIRGLP